MNQDEIYLQNLETHPIEKIFHDIISAKTKDVEVSRQLPPYHEQTMTETMEYALAIALEIVEEKRTQAS